MSNANAAAIALAKTIQLGNYCSVATLALYLLEYLVTLDQEIELVWSRKLTGANIIFLLNRYLVLILSIFKIGTWNCTQCQSCFVAALTMDGLTCVLYAVWAAFSAMRVYAIRGRDWPLALLVFVVGSVPFATNIYNFSQMRLIIFTPPDDCVILGSSDEAAQNKLLISTRVCAIASDFIVLLVTLYTTIGIKRTAAMVKVKVSLVSLLLRDGTIYFAVLLILSALQAGLYMSGVFDQMALFTQVLTPILISRFFFNLRQVYLPTDESTLRASQMSDLRFPSIVGNLGAPLSHGLQTATNSTWYTRSGDVPAEREYEDEVDPDGEAGVREHPRFAEEPLKVGLGLPVVGHDEIVLEERMMDPADQ
ncbi:hypothetical protein B0H21DRAFT_730400 [Amylocystis lapponica]|nr:hypothetical protein B0H21DRAFT_730400 [Amylocystis lapponica]